MFEKEIVFKNRVSLRAIVVGSIIAVALTLLFSSAARNYYVAGADGDSYLGKDALGFWLAMTLTWIIAVFVGGAISAMVSRSKSFKNGVLTGLTVWATAYLAIGVMLSLKAAGFETVLEIDDLSEALVMRDFAAELIALACGILGGFTGTYFERYSSPKKLESPSASKNPIQGTVLNPV